MGRPSWVVGAIHRIVQACFGDDGLVLSCAVNTGAGDRDNADTWLVDMSLTDFHGQGGAAPSNERKGMAAAGQAAKPGVGGFEVIT